MQLLVCHTAVSNISMISEYIRRRSSILAKLGALINDCSCFFFFLFLFLFSFFSSLRETYVVHLVFLLYANRSLNSTNNTVRNHLSYLTIFTRPVNKTNIIVVFLEFIFWCYFLLGIAKFFRTSSLSWKRSVLQKLSRQIHPFGVFPVNHASYWRHPMAVWPQSVNRTRCHSKEC